MEVERLGGVAAVVAVMMVAMTPTFVDYSDGVSHRTHVGVMDLLKHHTLHLFV